MNSKNINKTISIISKITKNKSKRLHEPNFCGQEIKFLSNSIRNKSVSTYGEETSKFEKEIRKKPNMQYLSSMGHQLCNYHCTQLGLGRIVRF